MAAHDKGPAGPDESEEPVVRDKRKIDPETGDVRDATGSDTDGLIEAEGPDVELSDADAALLAEAERDLVGEYRDRAARAEAELKNFRTRVERDRVANREAVIVEVIRTLLPAIDDLDRADAHGDLTEAARWRSSRRSSVPGSTATACAASARSARRSIPRYTRRSSRFRPQA